MRILLLLLLSFFISLNAFALSGEVYSETNYISKYGLLTDTQVRGHFYQNEILSLYAGVTMQRQDKISSDDMNLYDKNLVMPTLGGRVRLWNFLTVFAEYRTEDRSRFGLAAGQILEYQIKDAPVFTEGYAESVVLPSYHNNPVSTAWLKQGLRYRVTESGIVDPYIELYLRRSPDPNLGRDTEQARLGVRGIYLFGTWSAQLLIYQAYEKNESPQEEALFVLGGTF